MIKVMMLFMLSMLMLLTVLSVAMLVKFDCSDYPPKQQEHWIRMDILRRA